MNIHVVFHVLPNRKWHHRGRLHPSKHGGSGWAIGRTGRKEERSGESGKSEGRPRDLEADRERRGGPGRMAKIHMMIPSLR